jgi:Mn2+/Fe2+ NRAMP family transporter
MLFSQVANGILLPFVLIFMLLLVNRQTVMGEYRNSRFINVIAWSTAIIIMVLSLIYTIQIARQGG